MTRESLMNVPPAHRRIEAVQPGLFFADTCEMQWRDDSWGSDSGIAERLRRQDRLKVGFKRFVYNPEHGKLYIDEGWIFFKGTVIGKEDVLSGDAARKHKGFASNDILRSNVRNNDIDVIWFPEFGKIWQFYPEDRRI